MRGMNGASVRKGEKTMPKKKNFLGGMQNYNPNTGEYEPALKGPNGESPSGFKSFKKDKETSKSAFEDYNDKRTGKSKDKGLGYDPRNREESTRNHNKIIDAINEKYAKNKMSKQEYWDTIDREVDRWNNEQQYWYEKEDAPYDKDVAEQQAQRRKEIGDTGILEKNKDALNMLKSNFTDEEWKKVVTNENLVNGYLSGEYTAKDIKMAIKIDDEMKPTFDNAKAEDSTALSDELYDKMSELQKDFATSYYDEDEYLAEMEKLKGELEQKKDQLTEEDYNYMKESLDHYSKKPKDEDNSFEEINSKRMGKGTPKAEETQKSHKSADRKDKYGNPLVSDDAFKVGQKAAKEYLDQLNKGEGFDAAKSSFVTLGGFRDAISDALEQAGLNPDYDLTYQDLNEIIGSVTGEEVNFEDYEGNGKGWTGKKYSGYKPGETENHKYNSLDEVIKEWNSVLDSATKMSNDEFMAKYDELRKEFDRLGGNKKK